jgi:hypothetical protein
VISSRRNEIRESDGISVGDVRQDFVSIWSWVRRERF